MRYKDESKLIRSIYHLEEITHKYGNNEILERYEDVTTSDLDTAHVVVARQIEDMGIEHLLVWKKLVENLETWSQGPQHRAVDDNFRRTGGQSPCARTRYLVRLT